MSGAADAELVVLAVPSFAVASTAEKLAGIVKPETVLVNVGKGCTTSPVLSSTMLYLRADRTTTSFANFIGTPPSKIYEVTKNIIDYK